MKIGEIIGLDIDKNMEFGKNIHALFNEIISNSVRLSRIKLLKKYLTDSFDWDAEIAEHDELIHNFHYYLDQRFEWLKMNRTNEVQRLNKLRSKMKLNVTQARNKIDKIEPVPGIYVFKNNK